MEEAVSCEEVAGGRSFTSLVCGTKGNGRRSAPRCIFNSKSVREGGGWLPRLPPVSMGEVKGGTTGHPRKRGQAKGYTAPRQRLRSP